MMNCGLDWMFEKFHEKEIETPSSIFYKEVERWFADGGDLTHRLNYDELNQDSIVFDLGGFKGEWVSDIYSKYLCTVNVYEPISKYFEYIKDRFKRNSNIKIYNNAFSNIDEEIEISVNAESTSLFKTDNENLEVIKVIDFNEYLEFYEIVDLVKINIEGSEYDLLEGLNDDNIKKLKNIQVQFHTFVDNCMERKNKIRERLSRTHECTYCYEFVWENWKLK